MFSDFMTIDMLKVFMVAVSATVILTEFFKETVDWICKKFQVKVHTKYVVFFFALIVIFLPIILDKLISIETVATGFLNAILLCLTAMKSYDTIVDRAIARIEERKGEKSVDTKGD
ncbi:MAG TPA: hypothetical protein VFC70_05415 [Oscillospiraceae bacterium]|nr:hypothetical protein [Oscillospiraceae bacterium]